MHIPEYEMSPIRTPFASSECHLPCWGQRSCAEMIKATAWCDRVETVGDIAEVLRDSASRLGEQPTEVLRMELPYVIKGFPFVNPWCHNGVMVCAICSSNVFHVDAMFLRKHSFKCSWYFFCDIMTREGSYRAFTCTPAESNRADVVSRFGVQVHACCHAIFRSGNVSGW